ncbi:MAG TPA: hypothetical protein VGM67_19835 [Gemmatimonadaceae bacterium]|jgi:hypothetical protein
MNCGNNQKTGTTKYTIQAQDALTACKYAMDYADREAQRLMAIFENQACPGQCDSKRIIRKFSKTTFVNGGGLTYPDGTWAYSATAWVDYDIIVECYKAPPPPKPVKPTIPIGVTGGGGGGGSSETDPPTGTSSGPSSSTSGGSDAQAICNMPCHCMGPNCFAIHSHCPARAHEGSGGFEDSGCNLAGGHCSLPAGHDGGHYCTHGHAID